MSAPDEDDDPLIASLGVLRGVLRLRGYRLAVFNLVEGEDGTVRRFACEYAFPNGACYTLGGTDLGDLVAAAFALPHADDVRWPSGETYAR